MRRMIPLVLIQFIMNLKDHILHNYKTNTTEFGGNLDVDGKLTCQGGEEVITEIQAVIDEGKPQLNLKQGEDIVGICDLSPVISGGSGGLKRLDELFTYEQTEQNEFTISGKTFDEVKQIVLDNLNCGFLNEISSPNFTAALGQIGIVSYVTSNEIQITYMPHDDLVSVNIILHIKNRNGVAIITDM